ncbi:hypothetical protein [Sinorhizobium fredii]
MFDGGAPAVDQIVDAIRHRSVTDLKGNLLRGAVRGRLSRL